jgi:hypothetical protein
MIDFGAQHLTVELASQAQEGKAVVGRRRGMTPAAAFAILEAAKQTRSEYYG